MTGEITLHGNVLPIGGLKEKSMAAYREGMKCVLIPKANESDLYDVDGEVKKALRFLPMTNVAQVLSIALIRPKQPNKTSEPVKAPHHRKHAEASETAAPSATAAVCQ